MSDSSEVSSSAEMGSGDESEAELQVALREGLLSKNGLNVEKGVQKVMVNKKDKLELVYSKMHKKRDWVQTLHVSFAPELTFADSVSNDFDREATFMKQAQNAVTIALPRLHSLKVPIFRPDDYFAEMAKSDTHMHKVRRRLLDIQKTGEKRDAKKRLREQKKFATKVQHASKEKKHKEKRVLMEAVKKHRKGMKAQLETMLNNASSLAADEDGEPSGRREQRGNGGRRQKSKVSRTSRDKKFGYGGQKKRSKMNDKDSFESPFGQSKKGGSQQRLKLCNAFASLQLRYVTRLITNVIVRPIHLINKYLRRSVIFAEMATLWMNNWLGLKSGLFSVSALSMCNCFACGIFLATCFLGLIPHTLVSEAILRNHLFGPSNRSVNTHNDHMQSKPIGWAMFLDTNLMVLLGFLLIVLVEQSSHDHHHHLAIPDGAFNTKSFFLMLAMSFHSIFEGIALGAQHTSAQYLSLLGSIM
uniref:Uncharacterized protein n=1 Tax=Ditylenchus dipsaci TaxID=166011 RepID=A0A915DT03_9BILA